MCDRSFGAACRRARGSLVAGSLSATTRVLFRRPMVVKMMIVVLYRVGDGDLARSPRLSWGVASVAG